MQKPSVHILASQMRKIFQKSEIFLSRISLRSDKINHNTFGRKRKSSMKYVYKNGKILNGTKEMQVQTGLTILTEGENITAIVPEESTIRR